MANSLNRTIKSGEVVIIRSSIFVNKLSAKSRAFICQFGFGMSHIALDKLISGYWKDCGLPEDISGNWIDKEETEEYQNVLSKTLP